MARIFGNIDQYLRSGPRATMQVSGQSEVGARCNLRELPGQIDEVGLCRVDPQLRKSQVSLVTVALQDACLVVKKGLVK